MYEDFLAWLEMRKRFFEGFDAIYDAHEGKIIDAFQSDKSIQDELKLYADNEDEYEEAKGMLFDEFATRWLVEHNLAFIDSVQGFLPIKWKSIPREQWAEVADPTLTFFASMDKKSP